MTPPSGVSTANKVSYDNSISNLEATDVQNAIDEISEKLGINKEYIVTISTSINIGSIVAGATGSVNITVPDKPGYKALLVVYGFCTNYNIRMLKYSHLGITEGNNVYPFSFKNVGNSATESNTLCYFNIIYISDTSTISGVGVPQYMDITDQIVIHEGYINAGKVKSAYIQNGVAVINMAINTGSTQVVADIINSEYFPLSLISGAGISSTVKEACISTSGYMWIKFNSVYDSEQIISFVYPINKPISQVQSSEAKYITYDSTASSLSAIPNLQLLGDYLISRLEEDVPLTNIPDTENLWINHGSSWFKKKNGIVEIMLYGTYLHENVDLIYRTIYNLPISCRPISTIYKSNIILGVNDETEVTNYIQMNSICYISPSGNISIRAQPTNSEILLHIMFIAAEK